jgi:2-oxoglutarate dehydrogenase E2 component (dihydrolipoamide succinyltransferase)
MTRLRLRVAERLKGAQNTYAMLTTFNEVDMTGLMEMRNEYKVGGDVSYTYQVML